MSRPLCALVALAVLAVAAPPAVALAAPRRPKPRVSVDHAIVPSSGALRGRLVVDVRGYPVTGRVAQGSPRLRVRLRRRGVAVAAKTTSVVARGRSRRTSVPYRAVLSARDTRRLLRVAHASAAAASAPLNVAATLTQPLDTDGDGTVDGETSATDAASVTTAGASAYAIPSGLCNDPSDIAINRVCVTPPASIPYSAPGGTLYVGCPEYRWNAQPQAPILAAPYALSASVTTGPDIAGDTSTWFDGTGPDSQSYFFVAEPITGPGSVTTLACSYDPFS